MAGYPPPPPQAPYGYGPGGAPYPYSGALKPHRGGAVLALGIIGLVLCFICGIIAWVMANQDLREMAAGQMDPEGEGITRAGMVCGIIGVVLAIVWIGLYIMIIAIGASVF